VTEYYRGNPYPIKATLQGQEYILPKGFRVHVCQAPTLAGEHWVLDRRGDKCDFRTINGQPCLISALGVWDIFTDREAKRDI